LRERHGGRSDLRSNPNGAHDRTKVDEREEAYFAYLWNDLAFDKEHSLPAEDRKAYVSAYSRPGRSGLGGNILRLGPKTAKDFEEIAKDSVDDDGLRRCYS
jgi:hypothetical protein